MVLRQRFVRRRSLGLANGNAWVTMPLFSFKKPADLSRAQGALEATWRLLKPLLDDPDLEREHARLTFIIASLELATHDEQELIERCLERYWQP